MSAAAFLQKLAGYGEKIVLVDNEAACSAAALAQKSETLRAQLAPSIKPGDVAAVIGDYSMGAVAALLALAKLKAIIVPISTASAAQRAERLAIAAPQHVLSFEQGKLVYAAGKAVGEIHPLRQKLIERGHAGLVLFSSGSTGAAKAMLHDFDNMLGRYTGRQEKNHTLLALLMFDHIGGLDLLLGGLAMGAKLVFTPSRDANEVASVIARQRVNVLPASPTFLNLLLLAEAPQKHDLSCIQIIPYGTEPMPEPLLARLREAFPAARLVQTFGTSETGVVKTKKSENLWLRFDDAAIEHKIVGGELWLRSRTQILGYLNAPMNSFDNEGWFHTGDLVEEGENGALRIKGRAREVINVGGEKVLPAEVEAVLLSIPGVRDCVVFPAPNAITGQCVAAEIAADSGAGEEIKKEIRKACLQKLEPWKVPAKITLVDSVDAGERFKKKRLGRA
ncbi:MAG TPA: fatty acid--CoA ligase family protein [Alphaproteobacteria bacterium]|nr:fatty acid--CoA ligase family protein [Alphaproteobacteria bacterium]